MAATAAQLALQERLTSRLNRYRVQRGELLAHCPIGASDAANTAVKVAYLEGKIDVLEDVLDALDEQIGV